MNPLNPVDLLSRLVAIPSVSRQEDRVAGFLRDLLADQGLDARRVGNNVICAVQGARPGPVFLLNSHLDTVPARDGWLTDPWEPTIVEGRLVGLGSGDAKASVAAMACATAQIAREGLDRGTLIFAATCNEEIADPGIEEILPELGRIDAALVGEPTSLQAAVAQGGLLILEATARGRTAHAARAHLGLNALTVAARDLIALDALVLDRDHPFLGRSTANVTVLRGGSSHNVIPDACDYTIDIRYTPAWSPDELVALIDAATEAEIRVRSQRLVPVETSTEAPVARCLKEAHPEVSFFGSPTMSDWVFLKGVDAIKIGPGDSPRSHPANESVAVEEVERAVAVYAGCVRALLDGRDGSPMAISTPDLEGRR